MTVDRKTLEACSAWLKRANALDKARFAAKQAAAKPEGATSLNKALEESRRRAGGLTAADVSKQTGTARFVSWVNGISKARDDADRAAAERAAQRMQKGPAPSSGPNAAASNPRPDQVDGSGRTTTPPKGGNGGVASPSAPTSRVGPFSGSNSAASNQRPDQVAANGRVSGGLEDPQIGAGRVTPITVASTADGGPAAIFDFFNRRKRKGSN
ncbi:hypothetical protein ACX83H_01650 [Burkholderia pseudomallei]|uniref:hypothetical protein n=1 Tax=Burkholderia pseudomallei TaxID=28450 RepID=UPI000F07789D|nr:hypothetical protein [Burkholderia pseudomallei]MBF4040393.1 hypothetical protein [Burkholderia pseudomallei]CAJ3471873.1 Uncharacterised protein [Burkholderia pseudomallei]CAJ5609549.1 Uncharacterised protein [Burkholderia pseudomallei]CAJ9793356.1 Uncharacterised protein [Burkholderia pseudomallei]VCG67804.1 Uncharacterised protein [Burkholderia pseudomallei]